MFADIYPPSVNFTVPPQGLIDVVVAYVNAQFIS
jgi:hypothetical protein